MSRKLPDLVRKIVKWIRKLFHIKKGETTFEATEYRDETEILKPAHGYENQRELKRKMRKNKRDLRSITDPVERVRHMYTSILHMLPLLGIQFDKSDTTMDILRKTASAGEVFKEFSPFTTIYNEVRYGDKVPDIAMLAQAEGHFEKSVDVMSP